MRSTRVALTTLRRLERAEASLLSEQGQSRQGLLRVPPILSLEEWERVALPSQEALKQAAAEDAGLPINEPSLPDPYILREGIDFHRPDPNRRQENTGAIR